MAVTARDAWVIPVAAVVAGTVVAGGLVLLAADSLLRGVARVTGVRTW